MPESPKPAAWEVTTQTETVDMGPAGTFVPGVKIGFRTASGGVGSVFLPSDGYTLDRARTAISAKVATMDAIHQLRG